MEYVQLNPGDYKVSKININRDGDLLLSGAMKTTVVDLLNKKVLYDFGVQNAAVSDLNFSYDSSKAVVCDGAYMLYVFDVLRPGKPVEQYQIGTCRPSSCGFPYNTHSSSYFVTYRTKNRENKAAVLDLRTKAKVDAAGVGEFADDIPFLAKVIDNQEVCYGLFGPDEHTLVLAFASGRLAKLDLRNGKFAYFDSQHESLIHDISFSKDLNFCITSSLDNYVKIWNVHDGALFAQYNTHDNVFTADFNPICPHFVCSGGVPPSEVTTTHHTFNNINNRFFNYVNGVEFGQCYGHDAPTLSMRFSPLGKSFVSGSFTGLLRIFYLSDELLSLDEMGVEMQF